MSQKPVFKTRTQLVEEAIRTQILKGELKTGQPLRQDALAKEFNVSRIPVREALVQLEAQGLVTGEKQQRGKHLKQDVFGAMFARSSNKNVCCHAQIH